MIDNCLISDVDIRYSQNLLDDITLDPDWDLYQQNTDSSLCSSNSGGSGGTLRDKYSGTVTNKPYVNEVTLTGQKPPLKCC